MTLKTRIEKLEKKKGKNPLRVESFEIPYTFQVNENHRPIIEEFYKREGINPDDYDIVINRCVVGTDDSGFGWTTLEGERNGSKSDAQTA